MLDFMKKRRKKNRATSKRRANGQFRPEGKKAKRKPPTCRCKAYKFPHAKGGGACRK